MKPRRAVEPVSARRAVPAPVPFRGGGGFAADQRGVVSVEFAILIAILAPAAVALALAVNAALESYAATLQAHAQLLIETREIICASLADPPPACFP